MKTDEIVGQIEDYLQDYEKTALDCNPVFAQTQPQIIELIDLYSMDKFRDYNYDELGFLKPFYNVVDTPVQVAANFIDLDVKNIELLAEEGQSFYPVWLYEQDLRLWMKENKNCYADGRWLNFGLFLNSLVFNWPKYGHLVLKKADGKIYLMSLSNLSAEPGAESLANASYIIEKHDYSPYELREMKWDNIEEAIRKCEEDGHIFVYELYGKVEDYPENYFIIAVKPHKWFKNLGDGVLLHVDTLKELPYKELPFEKVSGRLLGKGQVEKLFHSQIYQNKIAEYKAKGAHWTSKHIYQSRDDTIDKNLMTEVKDGRILTITSEIMPIAVEERNLSFYREEEMRYDKLVDMRSFSWDVTRGERPPAGLTLGQSVLQTRAAGGFFQRKQEDLGSFLKDVLYDWILPEFKKAKRKAHHLMLGEFSEERLIQIKNLFLTNRTNEAIINLIAKTGHYPTAKEYEIQKGIIKEQLKKQKDIPIPTSYYDNLRAKINIVITGEQIDLASRISTLQTVMVMISQNPTILQDPNTRKIFMELLDLAGISPLKFETEAPELAETIRGMETAPVRAARGGSVARIPPITTPTEATVPTRL